MTIRLQALLTVIEAERGPLVRDRALEIARARLGCPDLGEWDEVPPLEAVHAFIGANLGLTVEEAAEATDGLYLIGGFEQRGRGLKWRDLYPNEIARHPILSHFAGQTIADGFLRASAEHEALPGEAEVQQFEIFAVRLETGQAFGGRMALTYRLPGEKPATVLLHYGAPDRDAACKWSLTYSGPALRHMAKGAEVVTAAMERGAAGGAVH